MQKLAIYTTARQEKPTGDALREVFDEEEWGEYVEIKAVVFAGLVMVTFPDYVDSGLWAEAIEALPTVNKVQQMRVKEVVA